MSTALAFDNPNDVPLWPTFQRFRSARPCVRRKVDQPKMAGTMHDAPAYPKYVAAPDAWSQAISACRIRPLNFWSPTDKADLILIDDPDLPFTVNGLLHPNGGYLIYRMPEPESFDKLFRLTEDWAVTWLGRAQLKFEGMRLEALGKKDACADGWELGKVWFLELRPKPTFEEPPAKPWWRFWS